MDPNQFNTTFYKRPGIRAQLIDKDKKMLINDFILRTQNVNGEQNLTENGKANDIIHCLNIASPGWTSAFPFANKIISELLGIDEQYLISNDSV